jgi:hypothetical protein
VRDIWRQKDSARQPISFSRGASHGVVFVKIGRRQQVGE